MTENDQNPNSSAPSGWAQFKSGLARGLAKTRKVLTADIKDLIAKTKLDDEFYEQLEERLILADCGMEAAGAFCSKLRESARSEKWDTPEKIRQACAKTAAEILEPLRPAPPPKHAAGALRVILVCGVNGSGKTTTIGKLAGRYAAEGLKVMLAAGDTFRAAAGEQLRHWAELNGVACAGSPGQDPSSVAFDAIESAKAKGFDLLIIDTAGRLGTQKHLMQELAKIHRTASKCLGRSPDEALLVIDANIGQNAISHIRAFGEACPLTGIVLTKIDGTAKGGILLAIAAQCPLPVAALGTGEKIADLAPFDPQAFGQALFSEAPQDSK